MYDELVKRLKKRAVNLKEKFSRNAELLSELMQAADAIEELQKALDAVNDAHNEGYDVGYWAGRRDYEPKWIPVTERLPEEDKWVLRYSAITEATWLAYLNSAGVWMDEQGEVHYVTHWMPLPEPPKEE